MLASSPQLVAGSLGHDISAAYVQTPLTAAGYRVSSQRFDFICMETPAEQLSAVSPTPFDVRARAGVLKDGNRGGRDGTCSGDPVRTPAGPASTPRPAKISQLQARHPGGEKKAKKIGTHTGKLCQPRHYICSGIGYSHSSASRTSCLAQIEKIHFRWRT
ncbi:hypothetical protein STAN_4217 [Streptomyces sp. CBMAI 2042]|nr:hypothetical protein STAN_4217 [Streptomyces sp. CBMAI 2042]